MYQNCYRRVLPSLFRKSFWKRCFKAGSVCYCDDRITWSPQVEMYVRKMVNRHDQLNEKMILINDLDQSEIKETSRSLQELAPVKELYYRLLAKRKELLELSSAMIDDVEFSKLVDEEMQEYRNEIHQVQQDLVTLLSPKGVDDENSAILEIRAGTGGKEASLFAAEIFAMYQKLSLGKNWDFEVLSHNVGEAEGIKDASASIAGENVFGSLKFEVGVHRVQRIPVTESQGRIHTSTITVAVLPQPNEIDINVNQADFKIETFRSSGPGGQHVNKTDSAVRVLHIPSGFTVSCQEDRSQIKNKLKAIKLLRTKLYDIERQKADKLRKETRKLQIGSGDRSERIRTYNFLQDRITDHRVGVSLHGVVEFLQGGEKLQYLIEELRTTEKILAFDKLVNLATNT